MSLPLIELPLTVTCAYDQSTKDEIVRSYQERGYNLTGSRIVEREVDRGCFLENWELTFASINQVALNHFNNQR